MRYLAALLVLLPAISAHAATIDPELQSRLLELYNHYNQTIHAGKLEEALALRSAAALQDLQLKTAANRKDFLEFSQATIPDRLEILHGTISKDGKKAVLYTIASRKIPTGATVRAELKIDFARENDLWKLGVLLFGVDPDKVPSCQSESFEPIGAYRETSGASIAGLVLRIAFEPQYTLLIVRVGGENNCAYFPNKDELSRSGVDPAALAPYASVEIEGRQHNSDPRKIWGDNLRIRSEE